jgi:small subunit ribosomal protein S9
METFKPGNRKYIYARGRRKSAVAQARLYAKGTGRVIVNGMELEAYFPTEILRQTAVLPMKATNTADQYDITVSVSGGGIRGQSDAVKLALARALVKADEGYRIPVKKSGFLTRDARVKERKKFGLRKARRAPQWSKR